MRLDIYEEEQSGFPAPRKPEPKILTKANSKRAELLSRILIFLNYKQPKVFAIRTAHLSCDDLEYMLSVAKNWNKNGLEASQRLFWKILRESQLKEVK